MTKEVEKNNSKSKFQKFTEHVSSLFETFKIILGGAFLIWVFFFLQPQKYLIESQIDSKCTLNARGQVICTFINDGAYEGSTCKTVIIERRNGVEHINKFDSSAYESTQRVCSGLIKSGDIAERNTFVFFHDKSGNEVAINKFCDSEGWLDDWGDGCRWYFKEQTYSRE